jgi:hypothetical protein
MKMGSTNVRFDLRKLTIALASTGLLAGAGTSMAATTGDFGAAAGTSAIDAMLDSLLAAEGPRRANRGQAQARDGRSNRRSADRSNRGKDRGNRGAERSGRGGERSSTQRDRKNAEGQSRKGSRNIESREIERERSENYGSRTVTVTDDQGRTGSRTTTNTYDPESGTRTYGRETTGPEGQTRNLDHQGTRSEGGYSGQTTYTDAQGRTATRDAEVNVDREAGTASKSTSLTTRDGRTVEKETNVVRTESGFESQTVVTGPDGQVATRSQSGDYDADAGTFSRDVTTTDAAGRTRDRNTTTTKTDDGFSRNTEIDGKAGGNTTRNADYARDPETGEWSREISGSRTPPGDGDGADGGDGGDGENGEG